MIPASKHHTAIYSLIPLSGTGERIGRATHGNPQTEYEQRNRQRGKKKSKRPKGLNISPKQNDAQQQLPQKSTPRVPHPTCCSTPPVCIAEHNTAWHGIPCWSIWVSCHGCIPSYQPLAHPSQLTVGGKRETETWCFTSIVQQKPKH